jgi:hypothetical protein
MAAEIDISHEALKETTSVQFSIKGKVILDEEYSRISPGIFIHKGSDYIPIDFYEIDNLIIALKLAKKAWKER